MTKTETQNRNNQKNGAARRGPSPRLSPHLEAFACEPDWGLPLVAGVLDPHLKVVHGPARGRGAVGLHDPDVVAMVMAAEVFDGQLVGGDDGEKSRAVDGVELGRERLSIQLRRRTLPLRRGPPPRRQTHRVHRRPCPGRCRRCRLRLLVGDHSPAQPPEKGKK